MKAVASKSLIVDVFGASLLFRCFIVQNSRASASWRAGGGLCSVVYSPSKFQSGFLPHRSRIQSSGVNVESLLSCSVASAEVSSVRLDAARPTQLVKYPLQLYRVFSQLPGAPF
jgi:hypothetical protein